MIVIVHLLDFRSCVVNLRKYVHLLLSNLNTVSSQCALDQLAKSSFCSRYVHAPFESVTEQSEGPMDIVASKCARGKLSIARKLADNP